MDLLAARPDALAWPPPPRPPPPEPGRRVGVILLGAEELLLLERPLGRRPAAVRPVASGRRFGPLRAVQACYAPPAGEGEWARALLAAFGALAPTSRWFAWGDGPGAGEGPLDGTTLPALRAALGAEPLRDLLRPCPAVQLLSHRLRALPRELELRAARVLRERWLREAVLLFGPEVGGRALVVGLAVAPGHRPPSRTIGQLRHLAGHLAAARWLREALRAAGALDPAARSVGPAAAALLAAQGRVRWVEPAEAAQRWDGLGDGRYAVVDHWAEGGLHRVLARRCLEASDPAALRSCEAALVRALARGLPLPAAGRELGISSRTAEQHLATARTRLRCASRRDLLAVASATPA